MLPHVPELSVYPLASAAMSTRQLSIRRGKTGDVQRFSLARPFSPATTQLLRETLSEDINEQRRSQILNDPTLCYQYACRWGGSVGFLTRPTVVVPDGGGDPIVIGSFSDTLGLSVPVSVPLIDFEGFFTTLVPRADAEASGLSIHPTAPDVVPGPPPRRNMDPVEASMDRLNFPMPEDPRMSTVRLSPLFPASFRLDLDRLSLILLVSLLTFLSVKLFPYLMCGCVDFNTPSLQITEDLSPLPALCFTSLDWLSKLVFPLLLPGMSWLKEF